MQDEAAPLVDDVEQSKYDPVSQPLFVIVCAVTLKCQETHESWISNSEGYSYISLANAEEDGSQTDDQAVL